jgi:hypothetical protein
MARLAPRCAAWALVASLAALLAGCGGRSPASGPFYPAKGKVTLPDGKPLGGVRVVFLGPVVSIVTTESDGTFTVKSGDKDGLPEGEYTIRLEVGDSSSKGKIKNARPPFPGKYLDEDLSDLKVKVTAAGPNDFDLKLTKDDGARDGARSTGRGPAKVRD